jgi:hypothetical protein
VSIGEECRWTARPAAVTPQLYEGPATFHLDRAEYRIPHLCVELHASRLLGSPIGLLMPVVIVFDRGELPKDKTKVGELRLSNGEELTGWWTGLRFEL